MNKPSPILADRLWQGGYRSLRKLPFKPDLHIHCAREVKPVGKPHRGLWIKLDDVMTEWWKNPQWINTVTRAAVEARKTLDRGGRVVVTCAMGLNRSGLISALALMAHKDMRANDAIKLIRKQRDPRALGNRSFVQFIQAVDRQIASK